MDNPVYTKVRAYAVIAGAKTPITHLQINYALNTIPTAAFAVPLGRDVTAGSEDATTLRAILQQGSWQDVSIYLGLSADPSVEPSYRLIFEGYVVSPHASITRTIMGGKTFFGVSCIGKIQALQSVPRATGNINAIISGNSDSILNAIVKDNATAATAAGAVAAMKENPFDDMWDTIKLLAENSIDNDNPYIDREIKKDKATIALGRINRVAPTADLNLIAAENASAEDMLKSQGLNYFADVWYNNNLENTFDVASIWDAIEQIRQDFVIYYVPTPENDFLLPLTLGLGGEPYKTITPAEYYHINIPEMDSQHPVVDAVVLFDETTPAANAWERDAFKIFAAAAFLDPEEEAASPITYPMPAWLVPKYPSGELAAQSLLGTVADASNPDGASAPVKTYNAGVTGIQKLTVAAAETFLYAKAFETRTLHLKGKLRTDIAPGSLVAVQIIGDRFGAGFSGLLYGHIAAVMLGVTGETASTEFIITALRFPDEHAKLPVTGHPLFEAGAIPGFPLVAEEE